MSAKRPVLHLIDGSGYIFRAYYAIRPLSTSQGVPTHAVLGFARMLQRLLMDERPTKLAIAFDTAEKNFRHALYPDYKANREVPPEDLTPQFPLIHELVRALDIPILLEAGFEADDLLATLASRAIASGYDVVLVSGDKDLMQLVSDHLTIVDPLKIQRFNREEVITKFGVGPEHVIDILALAGDTSDNIPGVPKVGPKSAAKLVQTFGDLESIISGLEKQTKRKAFEQNVLTHVESARLSKKLAALAYDAPVDLNLDTLTYGAPDADKLGPFLRKIEAFGLLREFGIDAEGERAPDAENASVRTTQPKRSIESGTSAASEEAALDRLIQSAMAEAQPPVKIDRESYVQVQKHSELDAIIAAARTQKRISVDLETTSIHASRATIVGIALAVPNRASAYVPVAHHYLGVPKQLGRDEVLASLRPLLEDAAIAKVGQNLKYDALVFFRAGIVLRGIAEDSMIAAYVLDPARASYGMDSLAREFLGHHSISYNDVTGTGAKRRGFDEVEIEVATRYAAEDADVALKLCDRLLPQVRASGLLPLYEELEMPLVPLLAEMEGHGILIDTAHLAELGKEVAGRLAAVEKRAYALIGEPINLGSPRQLAQLFFEKLNYPPVKKTKTGYSTDQEVLETLARTYELPAVILEHRLLSKLRSTYIDALPKMVQQETGRLHTSYNQTGTQTGRLSSSDPNLQNIPIRGEDGRRIRAAFIAEDGHDLISADYSQIELRIMAHMCQDEAFVEAFQRGEDIHQRCAREILAGGAEPTPEMRRRAKAINFGILYGLSEFGLSRQLNIPRAEAQAYIGRYFGRYPRIRELLDFNIAEGRKRGYVETLLGRRRPLPNLNSQNGTVRQGAERIAMNTPIQGSAADLIKLAMLRVDQALKKNNLKTRLLLQVHDELVLESPHAETERVVTLVKKEMSSVMRLRVPIVVDVGVGPNWAEAH